MKVGIDSYSYHRCFGEVYPNQQPAPKHYTIASFLVRAKQLGCDGGSLESCFFPNFEPSQLKILHRKLDDYGFDRVYAWGHPNGLEAGGNEKAKGRIFHWRGARRTANVEGRERQ